MPFAKAFDKQTEALIAFFHYYFFHGEDFTSWNPFPFSYNHHKKAFCFVLFCFIYILIWQTTIKYSLSSLLLLVYPTLVILPAIFHPTHIYILASPVLFKRACRERLLKALKQCLPGRIGSR